MKKRIAVCCYAGYQAGEKPRSLVIDGRRLQVKAILHQERIEELPSRKRRLVFDLLASDGGRYRILYDPARAGWYLLSRPPKGEEGITPGSDGDGP